MTSRIEATYRVKSDAAAIAARADSIALEQSVEMPLAPIGDAYILNEIVGRVEDIADRGGGCYDVRIGLAPVTTGNEAGQLLNMLFGNTSLQTDAMLIDAEFPEQTLAAFGGPHRGLDGLRARLKAKGALSSTALKPQGLKPAELARLAGAVARGGIDVIKDDHGIADQQYCPFAERVPAVAEAVAAAAVNSGTPTLYMPSLNGNLDALRRQIAVCRASGIAAALATPMLAGMAQFHTIVRENPDFIFMAHPGMAGVPMAPSFLLGKLFRLFGADATIFPNHGGRFGYSPGECLRLADFARAPWPGVKPSVPVPAGGMTLDRVPEILEFYGTDVMLMVGGSLLAAGSRITEETARYVAAVRAFKA